MKAFLSYSHKDLWALERLHTHLSMLRREGKIEEWYDREILAGGDIDTEIATQFKVCELFLALMSPDFLASNYCYEKEMVRALQRHEEGTMRVIPIIIEPCDWQSSPLQRFKALPQDGKPVSDWTNKNNAFLDVVVQLRRVIDETVTAKSARGSNAHSERSNPTRTYRIRKEFDEIDKADFRAAAFQVIRDYFRASITEIDQIEGIRARFRDMSAQSFTCSVSNQGLSRGVAHLTVYAGSQRSGLGDIYYSYRENADPSTANGTFDIESDDYELFLKSHMGLMFGDDRRLSPQDAAEALWSEFLEQAWISSD
jgi:hypothetical protein